MSLLLDALKRAEQEKLAKQGERPPPERAVRAAAPPVPPAAPAPSLELQPLNTPAAAAHAPAAAAHASAARNDAAAAQTMFNAKTGTAPAANSASAGPKKTTVLLLAAGAIVIVVAAIGVYVWFSINSMRPQITTLRPRAAPVAPPSADQPAIPKFDALIPTSPPPKAEASAAAAEARADARKTEPALETPAPAAREPRGEDLAASLLRESRAPAVQTPLRLQPAAAPKAQVPSNVARGYEQLRNGSLAEARRSYAAALGTDASSIDAQLGMATVEARLGNPAASASHYRRALDLDPRNATAVAGLASLADYSQPDVLETHLRSDIARYPQSAALHFSLGNLYASQGRWHDAQAAFFEAHRLEPAGADIAYNLAVSLDHVGQSRLASDFYRRALDGAGNQATQFDPASVARRLAELGR